MMTVIGWTDEGLTESESMAFASGSDRDPSNVAVRAGEGRGAPTGCSSAASTPQMSRTGEPVTGIVVRLDGPTRTSNDKVLHHR